VPPERINDALALTGELEAVIQNELSTADPGVFLRAEAGVPVGLEAVTEAGTSAIIDALVLLPNGIQAMSADIPGLVQTSLNLGTVRMDGGSVRAAYCVRSSVDSEKAALIKRLERLTARLGGTLELSGDYPAWEYRRDSPLCALMREVYRGQYGAEPKVMAFHAGLECGIFAKKLPGLDCVSAGPTILDIHTPRERMDIGSVQRLWAMVLEVLKRLK
ncbi:MAG: M20/M25/M40 family metallo-hydrolase, partial [Butyricicoccus sp.]|nr:M20/M25/M40 family metallo-hydrolase [Butyricicoccus sp.]